MSKNTFKSGFVSIIGRPNVGKSSFINTCNSYIGLYKELVNSMENYVNYLIRKSEGASAIESAYSRG